MRGVASQQVSTSSAPTTTATMPTASSNSATNLSSLPHFSDQHAQHPPYTYQPSTSTHPAGWDRPYSSGVPAPAVAVPIFRAAHASNLPDASHGVHRHAHPAHLPDSPPDTPPHSPRIPPVRLPSFVESRPISQQQRISPTGLTSTYATISNGWTRAAHANVRDQNGSTDVIYTGQTPCDSELESDSDSDISDGASQATLDQLTQAARSLLLDPESSCTKPQQSPLLNEAGDRSFSVNRNALAADLMPATPEISPDNDVRHHAHKSAHAFLQRIFANVPRDLAVEDAGVELVSPGWSGAVIKSGTAGVHPSSSFTSASSSDSSAEAQRTLYVSMPSLVDASLLREQVLAVLDAASEKLGCDSVMVCLDRAMSDFASVLHGLCYVGGALVAAALEAEQLGAGQSKLPTTDPVSGLQLRDGLVLVAIEL